MSDETPIPIPEEVQARIACHLSKSISLFGDAEDTGGEQKGMLEKMLASPEGRSNQQHASGRKEHPFDVEALTRLQVGNAHHSACIHAKVSSTVGLGFIDDDEDDDDGLSVVDKVLNPLCRTTWQETLADVAEDFYQVGWGYLEVVRRGGDAITGLHHVAPQDVRVYVDENYQEHYEVETAGTTGRKYFAPFGQREDVMKALALRNADDVSEIIVIRQPSSLSRWYGFPDWLAAVPSIELVQMMIQQKFDFFINRGVPEFMLFIVGQKLPKADWDNIETALRSQTGRGNSHKSLALNITNPDVKVQLEKLNMDAGGTSSWKEDKDSMALDIVSAHRVPPLLAGIQIPGKLGANNELPNALRAFQLLVVGPNQRVFFQTLGETLGNDPSIELTSGDFQFKTITDELDMDQLDTSSRMRQTETEAAQQGRSLDDGLRD